MSSVSARLAIKHPRVASAGGRDRFHEDEALLQGFVYPLIWGEGVNEEGRVLFPCPTTTPSLRSLPNLPHTTEQCDGGWEVKGWWWDRERNEEQERKKKRKTEQIRERN